MVSRSARRRPPLCVAARRALIHAQIGESLSGLVRAFFRAGAHGFLVTHWSIASGAAVPLMVDTFGAASDTAQALRQAQLQMIDAAGSGNNPIEPRRLRANINGQRPT
jgi:CHAT domain-containing protein